MKKILFAFIASIVLLSSCKKEDACNGNGKLSISAKTRQVRIREQELGSTNFIGESIYIQKGDVQIVELSKGKHKFDIVFDGNKPVGYEMFDITECKITSVEY